MDTEQQTPPEQTQPRARTFKPSSFQLASWTVVTETDTDGAFKPLAFEAIAQDRGSIDPLFENYDQEAAEQHVGDVDAATREEGGASNTVIIEDLSDEEAEEFRRKEQERRAREEAVQEKEAQEAEHARQIEETRIAALEQGRAEATKESEEKIQALEQKYATIIEDMQVQIREGLEGIERRAVEFCLQVTKKLVGASVEVSREYILEVIQEAVKVSGGATIKAIRVSPNDLEFLTKLNPEKQFKEFDGTWSFQADESVRAGCVIETSAGTVEYDLEKAWERIKDNVVKVR